MTANHNHFGMGVATTSGFDRFERPFADPIPSATPGRNNGRRDIAPATTGQQRQCDYCGTTRTPMWRRGPRGKHTLCNACGVKWKDGRIQIPLEDGTVSAGPNPVFTPPFGQPHPAPARFGDGRDAAAILHSLGGSNPAAPAAAPLRPPFGYERTQLPPLQPPQQSEQKIFVPVPSGGGMSAAAHNAWYGGDNEEDERSLKKRKFLSGASSGVSSPSHHSAAEAAMAAMGADLGAPLGSSERQRLEATIAKMEAELKKSQKEKEKLASRLTTLSHPERVWEESAADSQAANLLAELDTLKRELSMNRNRRRNAEEMVLRLCGLVTNNLNLDPDQGMDNAVQTIASIMAAAPPAMQPEASEAFLDTLANALTKEERLRTSKRVAIQSLTTNGDEAARPAINSNNNNSFDKSALYRHQHHHHPSSSHLDSMNIS